MAPVNGSCEAPGYRLVSLPDEYELFYSGMVVGEEVTLCTNGRMVNGTCVAYSAGECASGKVSLVTDAAFMAPVVGKCDAPGYTLTNISDEFTGIYKGIIAGTEVTLCDSGRKVNGTCSAYTTGDCDSGYYDLSTDAATFASPTRDACSSPYSAYNDTTHCDHNPGETCVTLPTATIDITWYDQNTVIHTNTCYYGDTFTVPAAPSRPGYTFNGWQIRN